MKWDKPRKQPELGTCDVCGETIFATSRRYMTCVRCCHGLLQRNPSDVPNGGQKDDREFERRLREAGL